MQSKTIYLANSYGFSSNEYRSLRPIINALTDLGVEVWEPFKRNNQDKTTKDWAYTIGQRDKRDVIEADGFFGIINGVEPDAGVMVELGIAIALEKPIFLFRDDFRTAADSDTYPLNLMIFSGLPRSGWEQYYYTSIEELSDPDKALAKWAKQ